MSIPEQVHDEVRRLLWTVREGDLKPDEAARLQALLAGDSEVRELYVVYSYLCGSLEWDHSARRDEVRDQGAGGRVRPSSFLLHPLPLAGGVLISYLIVVLIFGAGVLAARVWNSSRGELGIVAAAGHAPQPIQQDFEATVAGAPQVARIARVVDCRWAGSGAPAFPGERVVVGRRFDVASGRLEIAYDSGTTIVLEGPAGYQIDSPYGGYLLGGKLSASTFSAASPLAAAGGRPGAAVVSESVSLSHLTIIRTPTMVASTVGAEFSVAVADSGTSTARASRGRVALQLAGDKPDTAVPVYLNADFSALVEAAGIYHGITVKGPVPRSAAFASRELSADALMNLVCGDTKLQRSGAAELQRSGAADLQLVHFDLNAGEPAAGPVRGPSDRQTQKAYATPIVWQAKRQITSRAQFEPVKQGASAARRLVWAAYVAHGRIIAVRLNGRDLPIPKHDDDDEVVQFGKLLIEDGFRDGINEIEFQVAGNVAKADDSPLLRGGISMVFGGFRPIH